MGNLDGLAGVARMKSWSTYKTGMCLEAVWRALGSVPSIGPHAGRYGAAINAWNYGTQNHPGDLAGAPAGTPGYLSPGGNGFGHVFLFGGRGQIVSTDTPSGGRVGITTVEALCKAWGRTYLGYGLEFCGHQIVNTGVTYGAPAAPSAPTGGGSAPVGAHNPFGIGDVRGLQKISKMYGGNTTPDNIWGAGSAGGFTEFLRRHWGYVGNDALGPQMWAAIARWLRGRWGYKGNDVPGPIMRAALQNASNQNLAQL